MLRQSFSAKRILHNHSTLRVRNDLTRRLYRQRRLYASRVLADSATASTEITVMLHLSHMSESIASVTKTYISQSQHLKEFIRRGLINYTALAREICARSQVPFTRAAVVAASRYAERLQKQRSNDQKLEQILRKAKLTIRGRMLVAGVRRDGDRKRVTALHTAVKADGDDLTVVEGIAMISLTTASKHKALVRSIFRERIHTLLDDVAQITLETDSSAMFVPGLSSFVLGRLSGVGINVIEEYTCAGEHLLIVSEKDLPRALAAL